jgi:choline dehydrogenase-like flavoprotein
MSRPPIQLLANIDGLHVDSVVPFHAAEVVTVQYHTVTTQDLADVKRFHARTAKRQAHVAASIAAWDRQVDNNARKARIAEAAERRGKANAGIALVVNASTSWPFRA